jgi:hypothetical protein
MPKSSSSAKNIDKLLKPYSPEVQQLARKACKIVSELAPDAVQEIDWSAKLVGYSFIPGTYKGLILAIAPQRQYVNIMFGKGVEMVKEGLDDKGLLEGTGKHARHIKVRSEDILRSPTARKLIAAAVERTPRSK